jgi:hypothetical protein
MTHWCRTKNELEEAYARQRERAEREYQQLVSEVGEEEARRFADEIFNAHECSDFATNGGRCDFCGAVVSGSPADADERDYDPYDM